MRTLNRDLAPQWIYLKGFLFLCILVVASILLVLSDDRWVRLILVPVLIWSSARLYYMMFYVIERYIDPAFKFSGVMSFLGYLLTRRPDRTDGKANP